MKLTKQEVINHYEGLIQNLENTEIKGEISIPFSFKQVDNQPFKLYNKGLIYSGNQKMERVDWYTTPQQAISTIKEIINKLKQ